MSAQTLPAGEVGSSIEEAAPAARGMVASSVVGVIISMYFGVRVGSEM